MTARKGCLDTDAPQREGDYPGVVRRKPGGRYIAVMTYKRGWIIVGVTNGTAEHVGAEENRAAQLVDWPRL